MAFRRVSLVSGMALPVTFVGPDGKKFKVQPSGYTVQITDVLKPLGKVDLGGGVMIPAYTVSGSSADGFPPGVGEAWTLVHPLLYLPICWLEPNRRIATLSGYTIEEMHMGNSVYREFVATGIVLNLPR